MQDLGTPEEASGPPLGWGRALVEPRKVLGRARAVLKRILKALGTLRGRFKVDFGAPSGISWSLLMVPGRA